MKKVLAFTVSRANTPERLRSLISTVTEGRDRARAPFHWILYCPQDSLAATFAQSAQASALFDEVVVWPDNKGQHVAFNSAKDRAKEGGFDFLLRVDDDVEWLTHGWLAKLLHASSLFDDKAILGPKVVGLKNPPERTEEVEYQGIPVEFLTAAIGGICRLHPMPLLAAYDSDVRLPLGSGDAVGIGRYCLANVIPMVWVKTVKVRHLTAKQDNLDPKHKALQSLFYLIPYIPAWRPE